MNKKEIAVDIFSKKVCVVGLGYIGLPTSSLLACMGYDVYGVDISEKVVDTINQGKIHIVENDLEEYVRKAVESGKLRCGLQPKEADIFIICVPTPFYLCDTSVPKPNIQYVLDAAKNIAPYLKKGDIVILESTSPVGTTEKVADTIKEHRPELFEKDGSLYFGYCPERVLPGRIMEELVENDRIIGGINEDSGEIISVFYSSFVKGNVKVTNAKTAEMTKLVENSYRDVNIAFANEISLIADKENINVWDLISLANLHPRVNILNPGCGVGGHCIAVDPWFIVSDNEENARLIKTAREVNNRKPEWIVEKVLDYCADFRSEHGREPSVVCMGLAFKPDIDDLRESPALYIAETLNSKGVSLIAVEPHIESHPFLNLLQTEEALAKADCVLFLVAHSAFKKLNCSDKYVMDFCGVQK
ncbi:MAG: UDP-N-acetyl-D-mannosamine dehydrogenase [Deferribacterales bacterium]